MPAEIQNVIEYNLIELKITLYFSYWHKKANIKVLNISLKCLDEDNLCTNMRKFSFDKTETNWLSYNFSPN